MVDEWNSMKHPRYNKTRNEVYATKTDFIQEIDPLEQISMFWLNETKPKLYRAHGMILTVAGADYHFEVYDENGAIDLEFRRKYVNEKLIVSYDPEYLDEYIALYTLNDNNQKVFVAYAQKKREHAQVPILQTEETKSQLLRDLKVREMEEMRDWEAYQRIAERTGITREKLIDDQKAMISENSYEFEAKIMAYSTKEEQLTTNKKSIFNRLNKN